MEGGMRRVRLGFGSLSFCSASAIIGILYLEPAGALCLCVCVYVCMQGEGRGERGMWRDFR